MQSERQFSSMMHAGAWVMQNTWEQTPSSTAGHLGAYWWEERRLVTARYFQHLTELPMVQEVGLGDGGVGLLDNPLGPPEFCCCRCRCHGSGQTMYKLFQNRAV